MLIAPCSVWLAPAILARCLSGTIKDVEEVIANRGPKPLAQVIPGYIEPQFFQNRGQYFAHNTYVPKPLPKFSETRSKLPSPIFDEDPACVELYWRAWELAFRNFHEPATNSGFVSQFIDAAFNQNIFLWDTCFMTMFCNYGHPYVPGICSLDNFYCRQFEDGEICREIDRASGRPRPRPSPGCNPVPPRENRSVEL